MKGKEFMLVMKSNNLIENKKEELVEFGERRFVACCRGETEAK
ncbi:hypothetical protein [Bacillus toyonensis]|nr:hypothetical protein [Bacillus toyonensis]